MTRAKRAFGSKQPIGILFCEFHIVWNLEKGLAFSCFVGSTTMVPLSGGVFQRARPAQPGKSLEPNFSWELWGTFGTLFLFLGISCFPG